MRRLVVDVGAGRQDAAVDDDVGDVNPLRSEFPGHRLGQTAAGKLGGAESDGARPPADGGGSAGEDDGAAVALQHVLDGGLRAVQRRLRADRQRPPERFGVLLQQTVPRRRAGVVDQHVHWAERVVNLLEGVLDGHRVREVRRDGQCVAGRLRPESVGQRLEVQLRAGEQRDRTALPGGPLGERRPQVRPDARDDCRSRHVPTVDPGC